ncbi:hypothetical protein M0805_001075 [Coniferiporia weirii]|nr:hypothetical protein M0805_001075 [Coniferiporia weirii]
MSFPFSFRLSVPGISNPFSNSSPPPQTARTGKQPFEASNLHESWASPAPIYRRRPSPGPAPAPLVRKRGWVPSTAEPSCAAVVSTSTTGFLDTPAIYRDMSVAPNEGKDNEEVVVDLPPSKRRKGITGSVISTAFSAALVGAAVGLTVYRMWRDRGKEAEQIPPPPYQEEWHPVTPPEPQTVPTSPQPLQRSRTNPTTHKRHTAIVRNRQKVAIARKTARAIKDSSPKKPSLQIQQPVFQEHVEIDDQDDCKDEMDWIGDKLAQLIEEGKRALGKEIVVSSDAPEDEVDDGSGNWVEDEPRASTSYAHHSQGTVNFSSPTKRNRHRYTNSVSTLTPPRRSAVSLHSRFNSEGSGMLTNPRSPNQSTSFAPETSFSSSIGDSENEWASPHIRESMERARAAYRQNRGLDS